ncbi:MAG TPA: glycosyltransferase family 9 protein [Candidatus Limnocylindrales bacterium]
MSPDVLARARRILVVRLDNVGDVVMAGPAVRALRAAHPAAQLTLLASPAGAAVAPLLPWLDEVVVARAVWQDAGGRAPLDPARELALVERLRAGAFDAAIILTSFSQSPDGPAYACYLAGVPIRAGHAGAFSGSLLTHRAAPLPDAAHQVDRNLHLLAALGVPPVGSHLELAVPDGAAGRALTCLRESGVDPDRPFVLLAPGASCAARRYAPERFAEVAARLGATSGLPVVLAGSDRETELVAGIHAAASAMAADASRDPLPIVDLAGRTSVAELAALVRAATLVVANDSAPMHLADAFCRPTVVLFSGTELESQWRPRRAPAVLLRHHTVCAPCYSFECPYHMECLDIAPAEVVRHCLRLLAPARPRTGQALHGSALPARPGAAAAGPRAPLAASPGPRALRDRPAPALRAPTRPAPTRRNDRRHAAPADPDLARTRQLPVLPRGGPA